LQGGLTGQKRLDSQVRDATDFGFVQRFDLQARRNEDAVNKCQTVAGFTDRARRDDADLISACDLVFQKDAPIALQHANTFFDGLLADLA
jgi:hypothetical protein